MILMRKFIVSLNDKSVSVKFQVHLNYYRAFGRSLFFSAFFVPCDFIFASCRHSVAFNSVRFSTATYRICAFGKQMMVLYLS